MMCCDHSLRVSFLLSSFFNQHCNPCGLWPAQLLLSILSRKGFTECHCHWHIKPPTWITSDLEHSNSCHQVSLTSETMRANPSSGRRNCGWEIAENFAKSGDFLRVSTEVNCGDIKSPSKDDNSRNLFKSLMVINTNNQDCWCTYRAFCTVYCICPTDPQYLFTVSVSYSTPTCFDVNISSSGSLFLCMLKITKLIKWKYLYKWLLQRINRLNNQEWLTVFSFTYCLAVSRYGLCWPFWHLPTEQGQIILLSE